MGNPTICPKCNAAYDLDTFDPGYRFDCSCGQVLIRSADAGGPKKTSGMAIAALVLSLLFCIPLLPVVGSILGIVALVRLGKRPHLGGHGLAIAAIVLGLVVGVFGTGIMAAIAIPNFIMYQKRAKVSEVKVNARAIATAQQSHFLEYGAYLPAPPTPPAVPDGQAVPAEFGGAWEQLGFDPGPVRFQYEVQVATDELGQPYAAVIARGDLDADGVQSQFTMEVGPDGISELVSVDELE